MNIHTRYIADLRDALAHLYDPVHQPSDDLRALVSGDSIDDREAFKKAILAAISDLEPPSTDPAMARSGRLFELLHYRYVQQLTQAQTAERLGISPRHLRREQQEAVALLAERLIQQSQTGPIQRDQRGPVLGEPSDLDTGAGSGGWRDQAKREIQSLQHRDPVGSTDIAKAIASAVQLTGSLAEQHSVQLSTDSIEEGLTANIHPSGLRQVLISCISELLRRSITHIHITASQQGGVIVIAVSASPLSGTAEFVEEHIRHLLALQGGSITLLRDSDQASFLISVPSSARTTVLVVDDNLDLLHFYRRYVEGTGYHIVAAANWQQAIQSIEAKTPDVIVVDIMLPDVDGWEVLIGLHEHPETRNVPIIVCSVVRGEELALTLGASIYVPKPVNRRQFIDALAQAMSLAKAGSSRETANSATAD